MFCSLCLASLFQCDCPWPREMHHQPTLRTGSYVVLATALTDPFKGWAAENPPASKHSSPLAAPFGLCEPQDFSRSLIPLRHKVGKAILVQFSLWVEGTLFPQTPGNTWSL